MSHGRHDGRGSPGPRHYIESIEETSDVLGVSVDTVKRDWRMARAWLFAELAGEADPPR